MNSCSSIVLEREVLEEEVVASDMGAAGMIELERRKG